MITPKVLEPESESAEAGSLREIMAILEVAARESKNNTRIVSALVKVGQLLNTVESRSHRGLVDYDQRVHG